MYTTNFLSMFIALLVPPVIRERGGGLAFQLAGFTVVFFSLRILAAMLYHFVPRRSRHGRLPE
jgi:hypothetical protein